MIEYALLVMLGFCAAGLLALLIAPTIWRRAVRLTTKRLDATLPMSLSDIEADKDLLRASYAIQIRRLEAGLNKARDKSASQLVEISRLQMVIGELRDKASGMERQIEERSNAANVFERTIKKRFPELEAQLAAAKEALDERSFEITDLANTIRRKEEALSLIQRSSNMQQVEIRKLRETMEGSSADKTGRFKKRPAQWTLEEFRSEYDRLNLELSKMREQLSLAQEREVGQVAVLKGELQHLAQQIMTAVSNQEKQLAEHKRLAEAASAPQPSRDEAARPSPRTVPDRPTAAPQPWPGRPQTQASPAAREVARPAAAAVPVSQQAVSAPAAPAAKPAITSQPPEEPRAPKAERSYVRPSERRPSITSEAALSGAAKPEPGALKTLLNRAVSASTPKPVEAVAPAPVAAQPAAPAPVAVQTKASPPADKPAAPRVEPARAEVTAPVAPAVSASAAKPSEPNLDRMLREIFEGREQQIQPAAAAAPAADAEKAPVSEGPAKDKPSAEVGDDETDGDKKQSLIERLRVV